jgi:hypothetical protein
LTRHLRDPAVAKKVDLALSNRFQTLFEEQMMEISHKFAVLSIKSYWIQHMKQTNVHCQESLGFVILQWTWYVVVRKFDPHYCIQTASRNQVVFKKSLSRLRKEVCKSSRQDYKNWVRETIENVEHANLVGDSRRLFQFIRKLGQKSSAPTSLEGTDPHIWVAHFRKLLGESKCPTETATDNSPSLENLRTISVQWMLRGMAGINWTTNRWRSL